MSKRAIALDGVPEFPPEPELDVAVTWPAQAVPPADGSLHYIVVGGGGGTNLPHVAYGGGGGGGSCTVGGNGGNGGVAVIPYNAGDWVTIEYGAGESPQLSFSFSCDGCGCVTSHVYYTSDNRKLCNACNGMFLAARELEKAPKAFLASLAALFWKRT